MTYENAFAEAVKIARQHRMPCNIYHAPLYRDDWERVDEAYEPATARDGEILFRLGARIVATVRLVV